MPVKLDSRQTIAAAMIASGQPKHVIAKEIKAHASTLSHWQKEEAFIQAVDNFRTAMVFAIRDRVRALGHRATDTLEELLDSKQPAVRLKAATYILDAMHAIPKEAPLLEGELEMADQPPFVPTEEEIAAYKADKHSEGYVVVPKIPEAIKNLLPPHLQ